MSTNDISLANRHPIFGIVGKASMSVTHEAERARIALMRAGKDRLFVEMVSNIDPTASMLPSTIKAAPEEFNNGLWDFRLSYDDDENGALYVSIDFGSTTTHNDLYELLRDEMIATGDEEWVFDTRTVIQKIVDLAGE